MNKKCTLILLMASKIAIAQTEQNIALSSVSVTSSRIPQKADETGRNITVIDGGMFQNLPVNSLDELLRYVPGIEIQARGPMGSQSDIVIRGGTYQQTLVLIDGLKINDPITGHFNSYIPVAPYEIERIEVLRGPAAAVYGAEAVGGVVHIITKTFSQYNDSTTLHGQVKAGIGQYNFTTVDAGARYTSKPINATIGVLSNNTTGQPLRGNNKGYLYNNTASGSLAVKLNNNWQLAARASYDNRDFAAQNFYTTFVSDTATEQVSTLWGQMQLKKSGKKINHQIDIAYKQSKDQYRYNEVSSANNNTSDYLVAQYIGNSKLSKQIHAAWGATGSQRSIQSNDRGDHHTEQAAIFGTMLYSYNRWHFAGSLRSEWDGNYGLAILPQINATYKLPKVTLNANVGRAVRSADFTERYNNYNKPLVKSGSIGNPDLDAEKSWNYEVGTSTTVAKNIVVNTALFFRDQKNVIDWVNTRYAQMPRQTNLDPAGTYALASNVAEVKTTGWELNLDSRKTINGKHNLLLNTGIIWLSSNSNSSTPSYYIIAHARFMWRGTFVYSYKGLQVSVNALYKERNGSTASSINAQSATSYLLLNARVGYQVYKGLGAYMSCNNLTDIKYSDLLGSTMPGRWLMGGVSYKF